MSNDPSPPRQLSEIELAERMLRVNWNSTVVRHRRGYCSLPPEFVAQQGKTVQLVDVRESEELTGTVGHVPGSRWVPLAEVEAISRDVLEDTLIVVICDDGKRSAEAAMRLQTAGMSWVASMDGGLRAWKDRGFTTSRDDSILTRKNVEAPSVPMRPNRKGPLSLDEIRHHVGDPRTVRWAKLAAFLMHGKTSCVDGRDDHGVVGTPGGDAGEFLLTLASVEWITGKEIPGAQLPKLLLRWVEAFGHFYFHTDVNALNTYIKKLRADPRIPESSLPLRTDPPQAWRNFSAGPPQEIRQFVLEHLVGADTTGCGHIRFMLTKSAEYGIREGLVRDFLNAFVTTRWNGLVELEYVPLSGGHREGAVVNVRLEEDVQPYTLVPLISPQVSGMQMFVNHPDVTSYSRQLYADFVCQHLMLNGLGETDRAKVFGVMEALGAKQAGLTLGALAKGLPFYTVRFGKNREFTVEAN
ncbi:MAG: rhodanese-like domain-containing protein [Archangium sp.]|nr:rhodanese-like domain-containing protein [Archangium sp.]